jgi:hypothetical protein
MAYIRLGHGRYHGHRLHRHETADSPLAHDADRGAPSSGVAGVVWPLFLIGAREIGARVLILRRPHQRSTSTEILGFDREHRRRKIPRRLIGSNRTRWMSGAARLSPARLLPGRLTWPGSGGVSPGIDSSASIHLAAHAHHRVTGVDRSLRRSRLKAPAPNRCPSREEEEIRERDIRGAFEPLV